MGSVIDLTNDTPTPSPPPPPSSFHAPTTRRPTPSPKLRRSDEPPKKRRRVEDDSEEVRSGRSLKECMRSQIVPLVSKAISNLPKSDFILDKIAEQVILALITSDHFKRRFDDTGGYLTPDDESDLSEQALSATARLCAQAAYRTPVQSEEGQNGDQEQLPPSSPPVIDEPVVLRPPVEPKPPAIATHRRGGPSVKQLLQKPRRRRSFDEPTSLWFQTKHRPYRTAWEREQIRTGVGRFRAPLSECPDQPTVYHVDFTSEEVARLVELVNTGVPEKLPATIETLRFWVRNYYPVQTIVGNRLEGRSSEDVRNFCTDVLARRTTHHDRSSVLSFTRSPDVKAEHRQGRSSTQISSLLLAREMEGNKGFGKMRSLKNFANEFKRSREDGLDLIAEFTNCAGDISTISWVSDDSMVCGTTTHSDSHNQQYNKPGNLLLCSSSEGTLRAFPDHRVPRPLVERGENSTEAMRQSQEPWLYSSVVSSDYDPHHKLAYTSSFDKTVKVWKVDEETRSMKLLATWYHDGVVNFVAAAKDKSGRVASAADVPSKAVRIYTVNHDDIASSPYQSFSCSRKRASENDTTEPENWAYYPATMQWGIAKAAQHLLAVGYSPRSINSDDADIPEDKQNTGEITIWDANAGGRIPVTTATTANVFEIAWHPKLERFVCATSPCGTTPKKQGTRTQVHVFRRDLDRVEQAYCESQSLDCAASDINELTYQPNSYLEAYVTAACTDGKVYVWDTSRLDDPIHVLDHGDSLDGFDEDRERLDTGVKFTAWGTTPDRFYTGSSDGVVKVWNVRNMRKPYVRTLLEAPGPVSSGAFSPDKTKLAIGDATGRVFLFSLDKRDEPQSHYKALPGMKRQVRRPTPFIPHPEPPPPDAISDLGAMVENCDINREESIAEYSRRIYLQDGLLEITSNPVIGAVQGLNYSSSNLFCRDAHEDDDPSRPLLTHVERQQRYSLETDRGARRRSWRRLKNPEDILSGCAASTREERLAAHYSNVKKDLDVVNDLTPLEYMNLYREGAMLILEGHEDWEIAFEDDDDDD